MLPFVATRRSALPPASVTIRCPGSARTANGLLSNGPPGVGRCDSTTARRTRTAAPGPDCVLGDRGYDAAAIRRGLRTRHIVPRLAMRRTAHGKWPGAVGHGADVCLAQPLPALAPRYDKRADMRWPSSGSTVVSVARCQTSPRRSNTAVRVEHPGPLVCAALGMVTPNRRSASPCRAALTAHAMTSAPTSRSILSPR